MEGIFRIITSCSSSLGTDLINSLNEFLCSWKSMCWRNYLSVSQRQVCNFLVLKCHLGKMVGLV